MENYCKEPIISHQVDAHPFENIPNIFKIEVKSDGKKIRNRVNYGLRNFGIGSPICWTGQGKETAKAVSCAEIMKTYYKKLHQQTIITQMTTIEVWNPLLEGLDSLEVRRSSPIIHILLSLDPINEQSSGYQLHKNSRKNILNLSDLSLEMSFISKLINTVLPGDPDSLRSSLQGKWMLKMGEKIIREGDGSKIPKDGLKQEVILALRPLIMINNWGFFSAKNLRRVKIENNSGHRIRLWIGSNYSSTELTVPNLSNVIWTFTAFHSTDFNTSQWASLTYGNLHVDFPIYGTSQFGTVPVKTDNDFLILRNEIRCLDFDYVLPITF